ncbi:4-hydroxybenzoate polyprenyltransferase [Haloactinopolyspora alba]|uniref:4-hydroxybenzoate polyprenyltransferase n=1 Tax=Haloactinopolyspora alba TaxID=648780 RepID=A0A2P8EC08_9ACTN|nr:UbiA family prenyltransferase [Haloactinopolyspora alba]PSL06996.1 4-hydroxybenzoate polyprenyltransferase [Haloactinopolyspora alba]
MRLHDLAELVRLPAALTVPGDVLAGASAAGYPHGRRTWAMPVASACLYWSGMALNDYADRELDRAERPERPIPSGRVRPGQALAVAGGLTGAGLGLAAFGGGTRALRVAAPLAATVWGYDLLAKPTAAGPAFMAAARGLDVLLGADGRLRPAALPVTAMAVHTAGVTTLSRGEVHGTSPAVARVAVGTTVAAAVASAWPRGLSWRSAGVGDGVLARSALVPRASFTPGHTADAIPHPRRGLASRPGQTADRAQATRLAAAAGAAAVYAASVGRAQAAAVRRPDAPTVRTATGAGIRGMIPLQSALTARTGAIALAAGVLAAGPLAKLASKVVSPT